MIDMFMCKYEKIKEILKFAYQRKKMALDYLSLSIVHQKGKKEPPKGTWSFGVLLKYHIAELQVILKWELLVK